VVCSSCYSIQSIRIEVRVPVLALGKVHLEKVVNLELAIRIKREVGFKEDRVA
jgi:hypothetical protein